MIVCKNYTFAYKETILGGEVYYLFCDLFTSTYPSSIDVSSIKNFPQNYPSSAVKFACGSRLYCADSGTWYMMSDDNTWKLQSNMWDGGSY